MDDETLQRKAIEEIMREMQETKQKELQLTSERKVNPIGKPNKHFLGRTINSILTHNKRESDRKNRNCQLKLKELDDRANRRMNNKYFNGKSNKRSRSKSRSYIALSSGLSSFEESDRVLTKRSTKRKPKSKKKKRKRKKRRRDSSTSSSSSSPSRSSSSSSESYHSKQKLKGKSQYKAASSGFLALEEEEGKYYYDHFMGSYGEMVPAVNPALEYYAQHYSTLAAAATATAACNQLNNIYHYSSMMATASQIRKPILDNSANDGRILHRRKSTEHNSIHSSSLSLSCTSIDEDENGIPTINVSTDNETSDEVTASHREKRTISEDSDLQLVLNSTTGSDSSEKDDVNACIDLNSDSKSSSGSDSGNNVAIFSCSSESEDEVAAAGQSTTSDKHNSNLMIDLTNE